MAMPSSASTMAICVSKRLIETLCRDTTPAWARCLSTICCIGLNDRSEISFSPFRADHVVDARRNAGFLVRANHHQGRTKEWGTANTWRASKDAYTHVELAGEDKLQDGR